jgi:small-conductance mechanosensitive channel/CRP-like cAMP-binding protein
MSIWEHLLELTAASPFTGDWMSLGTSLVALLVLLFARRMLPPDERHRGRALIVFLLIAFLVGLLRVGLIAAGAGESTGGRLLGVVITFCAAMGAVGTMLLVLLEVLPARARLRVPSILRDLVRAAAFVLIAFGVLTQSGVNVASQITTAGVLTAVIGLALQNTIANLFAGVMLNMDRELAITDWVQVGQRVGQIVQIRWRSTLLRNPDGDTIIVPNSQMLGQDVYNFSRPQPRHRVWLRVGFAYRHPPNTVREVLVAAAREVPFVLGEPLPDAFPVEFGESAVVYAVRFWIEAVGRQKEIEGEVLARIWYAAKRANLEIPFPIRTVHMHAETDEKRLLSAEVERAERMSAVERVDLFTPLERTERELLANSMQRATFAKGEVIIRQGEPGESLYLLSHGEVAVSLRRNGTDQTLAMLSPGQFFGEMSLMTGETRTATVIARTDVVAYVVDHATVQQVLTLRPQVADDMSAILAARQAALEKKGGELGARVDRTAENRKRLLSMVRDFFHLDAR